MLFVSVTHGFSQVFGKSEFRPKPFKRFPKDRANVATWLKPGVNEKEYS